MFRRDIKDWLRKLTNAFRFPVTAPTHCTRTKLWIESHPKQGKYHVIDEAQVGERVPPKTIEGSLHWKFAKSDFSIPETYCASIPDGRCFSHYGVVITPDHQVLRDVSIDFKSASHTHFAVKRGNLPGIQRLEGKIGVLVSKGAHHYFHWLFDALCRVDLLRRSGLQVDRYIVHQSYPFHNQYLELLGIEEERIVPVEKQTHIQAEELVVPSLPNATWVVSQRSCSFLRSSIFESLGLRKNQNEGAKRRIYISRAKAEKRSVVDEEGLFAYLQDYGFERVILEGLPVGEQVQSRKSPCCDPRKRRVAAITRARLLHGTEAVATNSSIALSISSEIRMVSPRKWIPFSMTRIARAGLLCSCTLTVRRDILWPPMG